MVIYHENPFSFNTLMTRFREMAFVTRKVSITLRDERIKPIPREDDPKIPFGVANEEWNKLKNQYKDGDEFYFFASDERTWSLGMGRSGYVLIRNNEVVGIKWWRVQA